MTVSLRAMLCFVSLCAIASVARAEGYEMKDLEALEKLESWQEAVQHLGDIPPSKRNDTWQRIADKSAAGYLATLEGHALLHSADDMLKRYPTLKKSKSFMQARADLGLKAFGKTYGDSRHSQSDDPWLAELKTFVETDTLTPDLSLRAGKTITGRLVAYIAFPFFKKAIQGASGAGACKDSDVKASLVSALGSSVWVDDVKSIVEKMCFNDVKPGIEAELAKDNGDMVKNACPIFAAKKVTNAACK